MQPDGQLLHGAYNGLLVPIRALFAVYAAAGRIRGTHEGEEISQRLGWLPAPGPGSIWIQAASVGEVGVAGRLIEALRLERPHLSFLLTTTTHAGHALAKGAIGQNAQTAYFPLDFRSAVRRALGTVMPSLLLLVETEIWPNLLREAGARGIPVLVANGRISDRAFRRYGLIAPLVRSALETVSLACVQSGLDAERFETLGVAPERIRVTGNLKFASTRAPEGHGAARASASLAPLLGISTESEVVVAGSTAEGEEEAVLAAFDALPPPAAGRRILVLAPRKPARFDEVAALLSRRNRPWRRRSEAAGPGTDSPAPPGPDFARRAAPSEVVLLDSLGELPLVYPLATVAFVGGSLSPIGGHNIIEPAACGIAPIFGPHVENFRDAAARLLSAGGAFQVRDVIELLTLMRRLLAEPEARRIAGARASQVVAENAQAMDGAIQEILPFLPAAGRASA